MSAQVSISAADPRVVSFLQQQFGLPNFIATILAVRGIDSAEAAKRFFSPSLDRDWHNPYSIPGLSAVVDALETALRERRHIVVFGDFDVDGVSATAVMTRGLRALAGHVTPFIPLRFQEGYGLTLKAYERMKSLNPELIVTVDCGIASRHEVNAIRADGVDVVITDHHEPTELVPEGVPLVDPKTDPECPSTILAGVGVALKVIQALGSRFGYPNLWRSYTDLATLGTIADLMPMRDENRALVTEGLFGINNSPRPCLAALVAQAGMIGKKVTSTNISFSLIPRLNAAGRMGDAQVALDLLMSDDYNNACELAAQLEAINDKRRVIESELSEVVRTKAAKIYHGQRALVVAGEDWHEGVKGIVASRLVRTYGVPCLLFTIDGAEARGSGRTVGQINLFEAVRSTEDLLTRFGGHESAVGITLPAAHLEEFAQRICAHMDRQPESAFHPLIEIDAVVQLDELTLENVEKMEKLAPFGQENRLPCLLARDVALVNRRPVGAEKNHFSCSLSDGAAQTSAIMFHCTDIEALMRTDSVVNAAFELQIDEWRGRRSVKALLKSLAPVKMCGALEACLDPKKTRFMADLFATSDEELCESVPERSEDIETYEADREANRTVWEKRAALMPGCLQRDIIETILGDVALHDSQHSALDHLTHDRSALVVMATARGKSLIFQVHATYLALLEKKASVFIYPLRALIADQAYHLNNALAPFGMSVNVLTGESTPEERRATYEAVAQGTCDIVLTTPEFLDYHVDELARTQRIGFVVVDEAHHIGRAKAGQRVAYATMGAVIKQLGNPLVLALTATANGAVAREIAEVLPLDTCVFDSTERQNLLLDDKRGLKGREDYLANLIASGEKTVVYVNSRAQSVGLARILRKKVPQLALLIGFYNAGLTRRERTRIEEMFRTGSLTVLVTTSAFGEGVNIPDIRHVVLYNLPFNEIEFNQLSGRAGRDGANAGVHLLFGYGDAVVNERLLAAMTPDYDVLAQVYRCLRSLQRAATDYYFTTDTIKLAEIASSRNHPIPEESVLCALSVFRELGLIETHSSYAAGETTRSIHVVEDAAKVELHDSVRYREGLGERVIFEDFKRWALHESTETLQTRVSQPIVPPCASWSAESYILQQCIECNEA